MIRTSARSEGRPAPPTAFRRTTLSGLHEADELASYSDDGDLRGFSGRDAVIELVEPVLGDVSDLVPLWVDPYLTGGY